MSTSIKHKRQQREKVLAAARRCFVRHGFHATGMMEIARACRMSAGNIYHYFPNKSAIVQAITDEFRSRMATVLLPLEKHPDPIEGLVKAMLLSVQEICRDSNSRLWMEILAEASRNKLIRDICLDFDRDLKAILKRLMQRAAEQGQISASVDMDAAALWLVALLDGAIARLALQPDLDMTPTLNLLADGIRQSFGRPAN